MKPRVFLFLIACLAKHIGLAIVLGAGSASMANISDSLQAHGLGPDSTAGFKTVTADSINTRAIRAYMLNIPSYTEEYLLQNLGGDDVGLRLGLTSGNPNEFEFWAGGRFVSTHVETQLVTADSSALRASNANVMLADTIRTTRFMAPRVDFGNKNDPFPTNTTGPYLYRAVTDQTRLGIQGVIFQSGHTGSGFNRFYDSIWANSGFRAARIHTPGLLRADSGKFTDDVVIDSGLSVGAALTADSINSRALVVGGRLDAVGFKADTVKPMHHLSAPGISDFGYSGHAAHFNNNYGFVSHNGVDDWRNSFRQDSTIIKAPLRLRSDGVTPGGGLLDAVTVMADTIRALTVVTTPTWRIPDYVFEPGYARLSLAEIESFVSANRHLPDIPSAQEIAASGLDLAEMSLRLLKSVEELTLHVIDLNKQNKRLEGEVEALRAGETGGRQ